MPAKLLMVGDGPERPVMEEMVKEMGLDDDVRFLGKQEQMEEILVVRFSQCFQGIGCHLPAATT